METWFERVRRIGVDGFGMFGVFGEDSDRNSRLLCDSQPREVRHRLTKVVCSMMCSLVHLDLILDPCLQL